MAHLMSRVYTVMNRVAKCAAIAVVALARVSSAQAEVVIETVTVGDRGNADDTHDDGYGGVNYFYKIGKFEITAGQYTEFLNAVADDDTYELYNTEMWTSDYGCKIERTGSSPDYSYSVDAEWAHRPVNYVSWGDAARFANWLHNGKPTGAQGLSTTEDGSYYLNGATSDAALLAVVREPDATWVIPSEDEWYKAAYYDGGSGVYYDYPTGTDAIPDNGNPEGDTGNSANFYDGDIALGSPYWRNEVGFFGLSDSPYHTFDQGGNVWEWNEAALSGSDRGLRGGSFSLVESRLQASFRGLNFASFEYFLIGFRVAEVSEQAPVPVASEWAVFTMALLVLTAGTLVLARRRPCVVGLPRPCARTVVPSTHPRV